MSTPTIIDTWMHGHNRITAAFLLTGERTALVETGPKSSIEHVLRGLDEAGVDHLDYIIVTHIHLDHAGAAGTLAQRFPEATVCVHEVGAPHLVDPGKLWASATRIYGDAMEKLWAGIDPIPESRIQVLSDGDKIDLGDRSLQAVNTPGHASHHHSYLDDSTGIMFVGDALGVRLPDIGVVRPATPPPEFNLETSIASIGLIESLDPTEVWLTHYGPAGGVRVSQLCEQAVEALIKWAQWIQAARSTSLDLDEVTASVAERARSAMEDHITDDQVERMENTTSYSMNVAGYMRYFDKHVASTKK